MSEQTPNPAGILCGQGHRHASVDQVKTCYFGTAHPEPVTWADYAAKAPRVPVIPARPIVPPRTSATPTPASDAQLDAIRRHGVTPRLGMTRQDASDMLDRLIEAKNRRDAALAHAVRDPEAEPVMSRTSLGLPARMLFDIREGRYAVSLNGTKKLEFIRLSVVKQGLAKRPKQYVGCLKLQTQHGDSLQSRAYVTPEGEVMMVSTTMSAERLTEIFMGIIVDQRGAAKLYGREKGMCCRCGKTLTDERSRYYGIGPECEKHWPEFIDEVDGTEGQFIPGQMLEM